MVAHKCANTNEDDLFAGTLPLGARADCTRRRQRLQGKSSLWGGCEACVPYEGRCTARAGLTGPGGESDEGVRRLPKRPPSISVSRARQVHCGKCTCGWLYMGWPGEGTNLGSGWINQTVRARTRSPWTRTTPCAGHMWRDCGIDTEADTKHSPRLLPEWGMPSARAATPLAGIVCYPIKEWCCLRRADEDSEEMRRC